MVAHSRRRVAGFLSCGRISGQTRRHKKGSAAKGATKLNFENKRGGLLVSGFGSVGGPAVLQHVFGNGEDAGLAIKLKFVR